MSDKTENIKTVKVDVEAVIAEARRQGVLVPDAPSETPAQAPTLPAPPPAPAPTPAAASPAPSTIVIGRISG